MCYIELRSDFVSFQECVFTGKCGVQCVTLGNYVQKTVSAIPQLWTIISPAFLYAPMVWMQGLFALQRPL